MANRCSGKERLAVAYGTTPTWRMLAADFAQGHVGCRSAVCLYDCGTIFRMPALGDDLYTAFPSLQIRAGALALMVKTGCGGGNVGIDAAGHLALR